LENGDLRDWITGRFQFRPNLVLEVGRVTDTVDEEIEEAFGGEQALGFEFFDGFIADGDIGAAEVEHHIVVAALADPFKTQSLHSITP